MATRNTEITFVVHKSGQIRSPWLRGLHIIGETLAASGSASRADGCLPIHPDWLTAVLTSR